MPVFWEQMNVTTSWHLVRTTQMGSVIEPGDTTEFSMEAAGSVFIGWGVEVLLVVQRISKRKVRD